MSTYRVVVKDNNGTTIKTVGGGFSIKHAERVDNGVNINLNHECYYTLIEKEPDEEEDKKD